MSKRHQHSRRKSYGRRQHELRERADRGQLHERFELAWDDASDGAIAPALAYVESHPARLRFALGD